MSSAQPEYGVNEAELIRGDHGIITEPDNMKLNMVVAVGIAALVIFGIGAAWAALVHVQVVDEVLPDGAGPMPTVIAGNQYEVGIVNQWQFERDRRAWQHVEAQLDQLDGYDWVNRREGRIRQPIGVAMQQVLREQGAQQQQPGTPPQQQPLPQQPAAPGQQAPTTP